METVTKNKTTRFIHLGEMDYKEAWDFQERLFTETVDIKIANRKRPEAEQVQTNNYLIFCTHPHVFTLGKSGDEGHLLLSPDQLRNNQAQYYRINRGGDITYHGPGQIVGYPILDLEHFFTDIHRFMRTMEEAVIRTLAEYGIKGGRVEGLTGVWLDGDVAGKARKICALGVKCSRWVTMHGFAFNVSPDLNYFNFIVPSGIQDKAVTSMEKELGYAPDMMDVEQKLKRHLAELFEMELIDEKRH